MTDDIINLIFEDETIKEKVIKPVKRKAYPIFFGGVFFNLVVLILLVYLIARVNSLHTTVLK